MSAPIQRSDAFGYHTCDQLGAKCVCSVLSIGLKVGEVPPPDFMADVQKHLPRVNLVKNLVTIAGYIPVIGTIVAVAKLIIIGKAEKFIEKNKKEKSEVVIIQKEFQGYADGQKIRSWIEVTSLGFFLLIPDLIFTIGRNVSKKTVEDIA